MQRESDKRAEREDAVRNGRAHRAGKTGTIQDDARDVRRLQLYRAGIFAILKRKVKR